MSKIVDKMTKDLDLRAYHDDYKERIEALIISKMKGEVAQVKEERPKKPAAKSMMVALSEVAAELHLKANKIRRNGRVSHEGSMGVRLSPSPIHYIVVTV